MPLHSCLLAPKLKVELAGMFAIRATREYVVEEDFMKAARKIAAVKKLEGKLEYSKV